MTKMAVVIVNYNTREHLRACLDTIDGTSGEVIVVDNASCDGSAAMVRDDYPWATLVANQTNPGYGAGANQGIAASQAEYVLLLNSDTRLEPGALPALSRYLDDHPAVALVGPRLMNLDGTLQPSCYPFSTPGYVFLVESGLGKLARFIPGVRDAYLRTWSHRQARSVPWVLGAALAIRRTAFEAVGGFETSFFMYYEEVDLCVRLHSAGWHVDFAPVTTIAHVGGASTRQQRAQMLDRAYASLRQLYRRHYSPFRLFQLNLVIGAVVLGRLMRDSLRLCLSDDPDIRACLTEDCSGWLRVLGAKRLARFVADDRMQRQDGISATAPALRRADWRFLLPAPASGMFERLVLFGGPPGLDQRLIEAGIARQIDHTIPAGRSADALVILDGDVSQARLRQAVRSLRPGGVLYAEVDRRWSLSNLKATPASTVRLLEEFSLSTTGTYWLAPSLSAATKYIPLDTPGAVPWYLRTLCVAATPLQQLVEQGVQLLAALGGRRLSSLVPWYAVTAIAAPHAHGEGRSAILGHPKRPSVLHRSGLRPLLLTSGQDDGSRVVLLPFADGDCAPACVVKIARLPAFNTNIEQEQRMLRAVRGRLDSSFRRSVPEPLGLFYVEERAVGVESYATGQSIFVSSGRWRVSTEERIDDLRLATRWLAAFNRQTTVSTPASGAVEFIRRMDDRFDRYACAFDATPAEQQLFSAMREVAYPRVDAPVPLVWQHNDFGPWNLFRSGDELTVIDWELGWGPGFDHQGPALCDLLYFVTHWSFAARRLHDQAAWEQGFHQLFVEPNRRDELIVAARQAIDDYLTEMAIDRRFLEPLLVYTWVERALKRLDRRRLLGDVTGSARTGDQFAVYVRHLADHRAQFLATSHSLDGANQTVRDADHSDTTSLPLAAN